MSNQPNCECRGCIPMMVEMLALIAVFFIAVLSTVYPLISN